MPTPVTVVRALLMVALAVGLAAGGDDSSDSSKAADEPKAASTQDNGQSTNATNTAEPATAQGQIKALIAQVQQAFRDGDGQLVCDSLSETGKRDLLYYGQLVNIPGSCAEIAQTIGKRNQALQDKQPPADVLKVNVTGNEAVALIRLSKAPPVRQRYDRIDGDWKIHSLRLGEIVGGQPAP